QPRGATTDPSRQEVRDGPPLRVGIAVREGDGDLLVGGAHELGPACGPMVRERVVKTAEGRPRVDGDLLDADGVKEIDDENGPVPRRRAGAQSSAGHNGQPPVGAAAALRKSASVNP